MKVEATVDVGQNLTSLLERLAQQIGTTADKVFPWYVQQAYLEGVTTLVTAAVLVPALGLVFAIAVNRKHWAGDYNNQPTVAFFVSIVSVFALFMSCLIGTVESMEAVRKVLNPNYYAMSAITRDIGRLTAR